MAIGLKQRIVPENYNIGDRVRLTQECMEMHSLLPFGSVKKKEDSECLYISVIHSTTNEEWKIDVTDTDYIAEVFVSK